MRAIVKADKYGNLRLSFFKDLGIPANSNSRELLKSIKHFREKFGINCYTHDVITERNYEYESFARSKRAVIDYGMNNDWDFFVTITFDKKKIKDRYNADCVLRKLQNALKDYRRFYDSDFAYVLVPELHEDGAIHWHGLFKIGRIDLIEKHWDSEKRCVYYRLDFFYRRLGRFRLDKIYTNATYVSAYISKYITKANERIFQRRYLCSKGLKSGTVLIDCQGGEASQLYFRMCNAYDFEGNNIEPVVNRDFVQIYAIDSTTFNIIFQKGIDKY